MFDDNSPIYDKSFVRNERRVCRLVRTATKCFGEGSGGDEKSGCQGQFIHVFLTFSRKTVEIDSTASK